MTVTNNIYQKQIEYHVFSVVTNSELTELFPVFTIRPAFPTSVKKVNTSFKNVWRTGVPALPTLLADLMIFYPLGPTNFKNSANMIKIWNWFKAIGSFVLKSKKKTQVPYCLAFHAYAFNNPLGPFRNLSSHIVFYPHL